jgi:26S proteasome regulatory subunit N7
MAPFYESLCDEMKWKKDSTLLATLKAANDAEMKKLQEKLTDAEENLGETDISDALIAKAMYLARIGDKVSAQLLLTF